MLLENIFTYLMDLKKTVLNQKPTIDSILSEEVSTASPREMLLLSYIHELHRTIEKPYVSTTNYGVKGEGIMSGAPSDEEKIAKKLQQDMIDAAVSINPHELRFQGIEVHLSSKDRELLSIIAHYLALIGDVLDSK